MARLPIADRIRKERRQAEYYRVVEGLRQCNIVLYAEEFFELGRRSLVLPGQGGEEGGGEPGEFRLRRAGPQR